MDKAFLFLPHLEGDSWVRADFIVGLYRAPGSTRTEVHLSNGDITLTDLTPVAVLRKLARAWDLTEGN